MSIARPGEIDARHSLQPVILKPRDLEKLEAGDRDAAALQIGTELDAARSRVVPFAGYYTADEPGDETEEVAD